MNLPEFGVKKPVTNLMIFLSIILLALYCSTRIGINMLPEIEPPIISVVSAYYGASPEDVEIKVTEPLENQLAITPGLEKITSRSMEGMSIISMKFKWDTNIDVATNDIRDRIDQTRPLLPDIPDEMSSPFIFKFNTANIPIMAIGFTGEYSYSQLYDIIDKKIADVLKQVPGVGTVQLQGGKERQINVLIDRQRLEGYGLSITDIENAIKTENVTQPVGNIKTGLTDYLLRLPGEFSSPEEIKTVLLGKKDGKFIYLKDIATIEDGFKDENTVVRIDKNPGLIVFVQKQTGTNTVEVVKIVKKKLTELMKTLPADVKMTTVFDTSKDITNAIDSLTSSVWIAIIMVILVVWFFLRQFAPSMVVALTIPFSLIITYIYLFLSGKTINTISLSSIAIASGMVVDNAIVVVDNITRRLEQGQRATEAAIFGTQEMFLSIAASTLTTVVVFLPMFFIPGVVGVMFSELAVIVTVTLLASLFTAATFSPMLCSRWMKTKNLNTSNKEKKSFSKLIYAISEKMFVSWEVFYSKSLSWCLKHKKTVILGGIAIFGFAMWIAFFTKLIGNEFMPEEDTGDVRITVELPLGTRVEETDKVARKIEDILVGVKEKKYSYVRVGQVVGIGRMTGQSSGSHTIVSGLKLVSKTERKESVKVIAQRLRKQMATLPGVIKTDIATGSPLGQLIMGSSGKSVQVEIIGHSIEETNKIAEQIKSIMEKVVGTVDVTISREIDRPEMKIEIDREKAASLGLSVKTIADTIKTYIEGSSTTKYRENGKTYDIYLRLEESSRSQISDIDNLFILSPLSGKQIRLSNVAKVYESFGPVEIARKNRERFLTVECNTFNRSSGKVVEDIKSELSKIILPSDILVNIGGEAEEQAKAFKDLTLLLSLGIILVYMVIAAQFESLLDPFIIMFSIPFTFVGVIGGFLVSGVTLNVMSFLGVVMLMGIVVNNAIVLISYINILRARGFSIFEAITIGGKDRLRPVLMTTITTLVGLLPLAISNGEGSESWQPIGVSMLGGLTVSTLITLLFVPTLYAIFHRKQFKLEEQKAKTCVPCGGKNNV